MLLPDEGPDPTQWTWIAEEVEVSLEEAKADTRFPAEKRKHLKANGTVRKLEYLGGNPDNESDDCDSQRFKYVECWDIWRKRLYIWADGQDFDEFLVDKPYPDGVEDHPYALLLPIAIIEPEPSPYPKPLTYDWLPIQVQYNLNRVQEINAGRRSARKVFYDEQTFPDADAAQMALSSAADMQAVKVNDVKTGVPVVMPDPGMTADVWRNTPLLLNDWQRVSGSTGEQLGNPDADTATQAVIASQASSVRDSEMRTLVTEWLTEAGRKMLQLVKQTLTLDVWVQLRGMGDKDFQAFLQSPGFQSYMALRIGEQNVPMFLQMVTQMPGMQEVLKQRFGQLKPLQVTRSMLTMEVEIKAVPSTVRPVYRAQLLQLVQLLGPTALLSPTLLEELLHSFEIPQEERIAEELMLGLKQQQQMAQMAAQAKMGGGVPGGASPASASIPGGPQPGSAASPLGTQNPLGAAASGMAGA
jgi:hypothetical protein